MYSFSWNKAIICKVNVFGLDNKTAPPNANSNTLLSHSDK